MQVLEGHTDEALLGDLVEPVGELAVGAAETFIVTCHRTLIVLAMIRRGRAGHVHEVGQRVLTFTLAGVDRSQGSALFHLLSLILR